MNNVLRITMVEPRQSDLSLLSFRKAEHAQAVKWLKVPNLAAEVKRALKRSPDGKLWKPDNIERAGYNSDDNIRQMQKMFAISTPTAPHLMSEKEIRAELKKQAKRLS